MKELIRVMIVEDDEVTLNMNMKYLDGFEDIRVIAGERTKEKSIEMALKLKPDVLLLDINLTNNDDQFGMDVALYLYLNAPEIKIIMLSGLLNEDTIRSSIGLGVATNYLLKTELNKLPEAIRDTYYDRVRLNSTLVNIIVTEYQEALKHSMGSLTKQQIIVLQLFYRGHSVEEVAELMNLEIQSVRNYQQTIGKRCFGWKWRLKKLSTYELAQRAKVMGLF